MDCVRISLSWERKKKKKKSIHYMTAQSEVSEVPLPLLSLLVRKGTLKSTNDMYGRLV